MNIKKTFIILSVSIFVFFAIGTIQVHASATDNFYGQAWSMDSGWISFNNCSTPKTCTGVGYGVNMDVATGNLSGEAWSSELGWISFNETSGCPVPGCVTQPKINKTTGVFTGFARALSNGDGWDGWIPLSAADMGQSGWGMKENITTGSISGQAWGGLNMGWITPSGSLKIVDDPQDPFVEISADPISGDINVINPALTWNVTNNPTSCTASETAPSGATITWSGSKTFSGNSVSQGVLTKQGTYTYTLECKNAHGTVSASVTVTAGDPSGSTGTLTVSACTIPINGSSCTSTISWTTAKAVTPVTVERGYSPGGVITGGTGISGSINPTFSLPGTYPIDLKDNGAILDIKSVIVSCASSGTWNGTICESAPTTFTIKADPIAHGTITPPGTITVNKGDNQTYTITSDTSDPFSSYQIDTIIVDGSTVITLPAGTTAYSYQFTNITENHTISATFSLLPPPPPVDGECKTPAVHYQCAVGDSVNNQSNAKTWNWTCAGSPAIPPSSTTLGRPAGASASCVQNKPLYQEN